MLLTLSQAGVDFDASFPDDFDIVAFITPSGSLNCSFSNHLWANSMKSCQIGAAQFNPSQVHLVGDPSVFQAHTTVVI